MAREFCGATKVKATREQISSNLDERAVILYRKTGEYFGLDLIGSRIWSLIQQPTTVEDLRDALLEEFEVDAERCERDLVQLLGALEAEGLVEVDDAPPA